MSAANLYRYFESKLDIGAALAQQCLVEREDLLLTIVNDTSLSATEKLPAFIFQILKHTYEQFQSRPKLSELVEAMVTQRPDVSSQHQDSKLALLTQLLDQGQKSGEFDFDNAEEMADTIYSATFLFHFPLNMPIYDLDELEKKARNVSHLLLRGLLRE